MPSLPAHPLVPPLRARSAPVASCMAAVGSGSSEVGQPEKNAGTDSGPERAIGRSAFAVVAAAARPAKRKREGGFITSTLRVRACELALQPLLPRALGRPQCPPQGDGVI